MTGSSRLIALILVSAFLVSVVSWLPGCRKPPGRNAGIIRTDPESISRGQYLFTTKCITCHDPYSAMVKTGPGLMGIMKRRTLPVSERPATAESIRRQFLSPYDRMPVFTDLTEEEVGDILAFLNTL